MKKYTKILLFAALATTGPVMAGGVDTAALDSVRGYLGTTKAASADASRTFAGDALLWERFNDAVSVPSDEPVELKDGRRLLAGCRLHLCTSERGAVLLEANGHVVALAVLHVEPRADTKRGTEGDAGARKGYDFDLPTLTIFTRGTPVSDDARAVFIAWSSEKLAAQPALTPQQVADGKRHFSVQQRVL